MGSTGTLGPSLSSFFGITIDHQPGFSGSAVSESQLEGSLLEPLRHWLSRCWGGRFPVANFSSKISGNRVGRPGAFSFFAMEGIVSIVATFTKKFNGYTLSFPHEFLSFRTIVAIFHNLRDNSYHRSTMVDSWNIIWHLHQCIVELVQGSTRLGQHMSWTICWSICQVLGEFSNFYLKKILIYLLWVNYNDLTVLPHWNHGLFEGNHPQMAQEFRLVKYDNLPRSTVLWVKQCHEAIFFFSPRPLSEPVLIIPDSL